MKKFDYARELKFLYKPSSKKVSSVEVPSMKFLMLDGQGDPNTSEEFSQAVEILFSLSYALKFSIKNQGIVDYRVFPLEGLWWSDNMDDFLSGNKKNWQWTLMIAQPEWISDSHYQEQLGLVKVKKNLPDSVKVRFDVFKEGKVAQIMHIGPFSEEGPAIKKVHEFIKETGGKPSDLHHEIYLSDIRKGKSENWKTIIRQPFNLSL